jgi:hypothetical protein
MYSRIHDLPKTITLHAFLKKLFAIRTWLGAQNFILFVDTDHDKNTPTKL